MPGPQGSGARDSETALMKTTIALVFVTLFTLLSLPVFAGDAYSRGYDQAVAGDYETAFATWLPLARSGDARAQFNLGLIYHAGLHGPIDEQKAVFWYIQAARNGVREAQEYLAVAYREGWFGLRRDVRKADYWERRLENETGL